MIFRGKYQILGLIAMFAMFCAADIVMAQRGRGGDRGGSPFGQTSALNLLGQESVQQHLELVDDQVDSIKELQDDQRNAMREMFMGMRDRIQDMDEDERRELMGELQAKLKDKNKELEDQVNDQILLPHQTERLNQLMVQSRNRRGGTGSFSEETIDALGITEDQLEALKKKAEEVQEKLSEKFAKMRAQAEEEVLSVLTEEQRSKYKEMVGDAYDFNRGGGGGGGDRGGRGGGDRGGGDRGGGDRGGRGGGDRGGRGGGNRPSADGGRGSDF